MTKAEEQEQIEMLKRLAQSRARQEGKVFTEAQLDAFVERMKRDEPMPWFTVVKDPTLIHELNKKLFEKIGTKGNS